MPHARAHPLVAAQVEAFRRWRPVRAGSLIITVYGDAIAPRGGTVSLASLLKLLQAFGLSQGLVRTAMSRLGADGWLGRRTIGRRSFYGLTKSGRRRFEDATRRIYGGGPPLTWARTWQLVIAPGGPGEQRESLRKELGWLGFGQLAPGVMIRPFTEHGSLDAVLEELSDPRAVILIDGRSGLPADPEALRRLASACWSLDDLAAGYRAFLDRFAPLGHALAAGERLRPLDGLLVRVLLIHEYRRVMLRDPMLPPALLPEGWIGRDAYGLCKAIYGAVVGGAEAWISENLTTETGPLPPPDAGSAARFGGPDVAPP